MSETLTRARPAFSPWPLSEYSAARFRQWSKAGAGATEYLGHVEVPTHEWISLADNPRQRDTIEHARRASHLKALHPTHAHVAMAVLPHGQAMKLDGHTRAYLWASGEVDPPPVVTVAVWGCPTIEAAKELYSSFDSAAAVETGVDQVQGALREVGLTLTSPALRIGKFGSALRRSYQKVTHVFNDKVWRNPDYIADAIRYFREAIQSLDDLQPHAKRFPAGLIGASFVTLKRHPSPALKFWTAYRDDAGTSDGKTMDGVMALSKAVAAAHHRKSADAWAGLFLRGVAACEHYRVGRGYDARQGMRPWKNKDVDKLLDTMPDGDTAVHRERWRLLMSSGEQP